jgi:hypothetical protein
MNNFESKGLKCIIWAGAALISLAAAITAVVVFREQIATICADLKYKIADKKSLFTKNDEFENYADI